jgi:methyl-accepting chemotaxis protein
MNRLKYYQKFTLVGVFIILLVMGMMYMFLNNLYREIAFNARENLGVRYINPLRSLLFSVQKQRGGAGRPSFDFSALDAVDAELNSTLEIGERLKELKKELNRAGSGDLDGPTEKIIALISHVNDTSNLVLDPDLDTYYLMDAFSLKLPVLTEKIHQSGIAAKKLASLGADSADSQKLWIDLVMLMTFIEDINSALKKGSEVMYEFRPSVKSDVGGAFDAAYSANAAFTGLLRKWVESPKNSDTDAAGKLDRALNEAVSRTTVLYDACARELETLIQRRVDRYRSQIPVAAAFIVAALLCIAYLFAGFYMSVFNSLATIMNGMAKIADGDLGVSIKSETRDEMSGLIDSVNNTVRNIEKIIASVKNAGDNLIETAGEFSSLAEQTRKSMDGFTSSVDEIGTVLDSLASAGENVNASSEEVAAGAQHTAQMGTEMARCVNDAMSSGENGMNAVRSVVNEIGGVAEGVSKAASDIMTLGDNARQIQNFVTQINGIAGQTNLLALNAAIESARAGEAGRGFSVVAEEVRKLAEESSLASKKIAGLAETIAADIERIVKLSEKNAQISGDARKLSTETEGIISSMMNGLRTISDRTESLSAVSEEQAASSGEIAESVQGIALKVKNAAAASEDIRGGVRGVASMVERMTKGADGLSRLAGELSDVLAFFRMS